MSFFPRGRRRWLARAAGAAAAVLALALGVQLLEARVPSSRSVMVAIAANDHNGVLSWQDRLELSAHGGGFERVAVSDSEGHALRGVIDPTRTRWRNSAALVPELIYTVRAELVDRVGGHHVRTTRLRTTPPKVRVDATITPGDGDVVGIGMPVIVRFDHDIDPTKRARVLQRLKVHAAPTTTGSWRWMTARQLHWRPQQYWTPHTSVIASVDLARLDLGNGAWGSRRHVVQFRIGDAHVSVADAATHTMVVTDNSQPLRTLPISAGRQAFPSRNGVHVALSKQPSVVMDSATVGIPRNSPDGYYETVEWDVRISYAGAFVHAAPWSVPDQGQRNVSHGCINLSTADAQWFYDFTLRGDIVEIRSAGAPPDLADPGTADWNLSWDDWQHT